MRIRCEYPLGDPAIVSCFASPATLAGQTVASTPSKGLLNMYLDRIRLKSIKSFDNLDFSFGRRPAATPPKTAKAQEGQYAGLWVITGDNASGKTTLLKAIALALVGPSNAYRLQPSLRGWVSDGADEGTITVNIVQSSPGDYFQGKGGTTNRNVLDGVLQLSRRRRNSDEGETSMESRQVPKSSLRRGPWNEFPDGWFCCGYGPFRRLSGATADAQRIQSSERAEARLATAFLEGATLGECELWLKELHHKALENKKVETERLTAVRQLLDDNFLHNGLRVDRIDSDGLWLRHPRGRASLQEMSDGYRSALALLVDILRHLAYELGSDPLVEERDGNVVVPHRGIVLIDEMDSHLHPEWQRKMGPGLKRRFPGMQFIMSSYSAFPCQTADGIFRLPSPQSQEQPCRLDDEARHRIADETPSQIFRGPAFGMEFTRSLEAASGRCTLVRGGST